MHSAEKTDLLLARTRPLRRVSSHAGMQVCRCLEGATHSRDGRFPAARGHEENALGARPEGGGTNTAAEMATLQQLVKMPR